MIEFIKYKTIFLNRISTFQLLLYIHRRSPRNIDSSINKKAEIKEPKRFVPSNLTVNSSNFKFSQGNRQANQQKTATPKKPFAFSATQNLKNIKPEKILSNITNSPSFNKQTVISQNNFNYKDKTVKPSIRYKPYTGKVGQWNPKKTFEERKALANKIVTKTKKGEIIKGVRLNKRAELLMKKRGINTEN